MTLLTRPLALLAGVGLALGAIAYAPTSQAGSRVAVAVGVPPPPVRAVHVHPRPGYVWVQGYWRWNPRIHRYTWVDGNWVRARPGYRYRPAYWVRDGREWHFHRGHWER